MELIFIVAFLEYFYIDKQNISMFFNLCTNLFWHKEW